MLDHLAIQCADVATSAAFYEAALATGAEALHEPRVRPKYHRSYFGALVRDPDGNNVEAACHLPGG